MKSLWNLSISASAASLPPTLTRLTVLARGLGAEMSWVLTVLGPRGRDLRSLVILSVSSSLGLRPRRAQDNNLVNRDFSVSLLVAVLLLVVVAG